MNKIQLPVTAVQNEVVKMSWYVQDAFGQFVLAGIEQHVKEAVELINAAAELPFEIIEDGDAIKLSDDGSEFDGAVGTLEKLGSVDYGDWWCWRSNHGKRAYYDTRPDKYGSTVFSLVMPTAFQLINGIHLLETNGVVSTEDEAEVVV